MFLVIAVSPGTAHGQSRIAVKRDLNWSRPGNEITTPQFSMDGNLIVLVSRVHVPDGGDAEGLPESYFKGLEERQKREPRFADPTIELIDLKGKTICEASYGWNPSISPDNKKLVYSRQKNPITGLRVLAETQAGNDIQIFDCEKRQTRLVAEPDAGYLDNPFFFPDGNSIVYTENEAVNRASGGPVGLTRVDLRQNEKTSLLSKTAVPAVPCPPARSDGPTQVSYVCSQMENPTGNFPQLLLQFAPVGNQLVALLGTPVPSPGDMYLAKDYDISLLSVLPEKKRILSIGKEEMANDEEDSFQAASDQRVMIFSHYWRPFSLTTGKWLPDLGPRNTRRTSTYSPDLKYYLTSEPTDAPDHFVLYQAASGQKLQSFPKMITALEAVWSRDSKRLAIVGVPANVGKVYREELGVFSLP
jgi:WD40-like Beta Propeller Repeat